MKKINTIKPQEGRSRDWLPAGKKEQHQMPSFLKAAPLLSTSKKYFKVKKAFIYSPPLFHGHWPWGSTRSTFTTEMHRATPPRSFVHWTVRTCAFILKRHHLMETFRGIVFSSPLLSLSLSVAGSLKAPPPPPPMGAPASMKYGSLALIWNSNED